MRSQILIMLVFSFFIIMISMQYTLNKILYELREVKKIISRNYNKIDEK